MAKRGEAETLVHDVYMQLRLRILIGTIAPSSRLKPAQLCKEFDVSTGVIREALTMLAEQNLVRGERNRGFQVVPLSIEELRRLTRARIINECGAIREAIEFGDLAWESEVKGAHHLLMRTHAYFDDEQLHPNDKFIQAHESFHFAMIKGCGNPFLIEICQRLFDASNMYRRFAKKVSRDHSGEHTAIMEAVIQRKADLAVQLHKEHIERTSLNLEDWLSESNLNGK